MLARVRTHVTVGTLLRHRQFATLRHEDLAYTVIYKSGVATSSTQITRILLRAPVARGPRCAGHETSDNPTRHQRRAFRQEAGNP